MAETPESPSGGAAAPANQGKWKAHSDTNMMEARNLMRDMLTVCRKNEIAEAASKGASMETEKREKEVKKAKVMNQAAAHETVIATSFQCMQDIEDAILQTEDSLTKLTHERYKGFACLQVAERRQEIREKRPVAELFKDALTDALANEKSVLQLFRKELFALEADGKHIIEELRNKRSFLSHDTGERRLAMMEDQKTLVPDLTIPIPKTKHDKKVESPKNSAEEEPPPAEAAAEAPAASALSPEEQKQAAQDKKKAEQASQELIAGTMKLLEMTASHRHKTFEKVIVVKQESARALLRTEETLARRTTELAAMKKQLESHALDVEAAIQRAERSLERSSKRLDSKDVQKVEKMKADKSMLDQLRGIRARLAEDIRNKFSALEIDNTCRRVTPAKASEAKIKQAMVRTNSAPSLGSRKKTVDPRSPGSTSSFGETGMTATTDSAESQDSTRPPSTNKPFHSPGCSKSLKAGAAAGLAQ